MGNNADYIDLILATVKPEEKETVKLPKIKHTHQHQQKEECISEYQE